MSTDRAGVAIAGGGLAGLSLALQVSRSVPACPVTVIDARRRPAPERTSSVGESFSELGSHYLRDVLGLSDHLERHELPKFGLRFFIGNAWDLHDRFELGNLSTAIADVEDGRLLGLPLRTHQVDRARLENEIARRCRDQGVRFLENTTVVDCQLDADGHRIHLEGEHAGEVLADWFVAASGKDVPGLPLSRRPLDHRVGAVWFRVEGVLDPGTWSTHPDYEAATPPGFRRLSTNHFMNSGFWIWLIPLPSGVTSVGIVWDRDVEDGPPEGFAEILEWIRERDARLGAELAPARPVDPAPHRVEADASVVRSFHPERWAVVGAGAAFVDVLYSPGIDLIALANTLLSDIIQKDRMQKPVAGACALANTVFEGFADGLAEIYRGQYKNFGRAEVLGSKAVWDSAVYFGFNTLLFRHGLSGDARFLSRIQPELLALKTLQSRVQARFRRGDPVPLMATGSAMVEWGSIDWMLDAYFGARQQPDEDHVRGQLRAVVKSLEQVGRQLHGVA